MWLGCSVSTYVYSLDVYLNLFILVLGARCSVLGASLLELNSHSNLTFRPPARRRRRVQSGAPSPSPVPLPFQQQTMQQPEMQQQEMQQLQQEMQMGEEQWMEMQVQRLLLVSMHTV